MQHTLIPYQTNQKNNFSFPFELEEIYTSVKIKKNVTNEIPNINNKIEGALFLAETLKEEVLQGTFAQKKKNVKQLKKLLQQFVAISVMTGVSLSLGMILADPHSASASSLMTTTTNETMGVQITPDSIMDWAFKISLIISVLGVGLAMAMFGLVGIYHLFTRNTAKVIDWNSNIIKGAVQAIVSIPLIWALYLLAQSVFKHLPNLEGFFLN